MNTKRIFMSKDLFKKLREETGVDYCPNLGVCMAFSERDNVYLHDVHCENEKNKYGIIITDKDFGMIDVSSNILKTSESFRHKMLSNKNQLAAISVQPQDHIIYYTYNCELLSIITEKFVIKSISNNSLFPELELDIIESTVYPISGIDDLTGADRNLIHFIHKKRIDTKHPEYYARNRSVITGLGFFLPDKNGAFHGISRFRQNLSLDKRSKETTNTKPFILKYSLLSMYSKNEVVFVDGYKFEVITNYEDLTPLLDSEERLNNLKRFHLKNGSIVYGYSSKKNGVDADFIYYKKTDTQLSLFQMNRYESSFIRHEELISETHKV